MSQPNLTANTFILHYSFIIGLMLEIFSKIYKGHGYFIDVGVIDKKWGLRSRLSRYSAAENPTQTVTSFGGLIFMIVCACYIDLAILIEAGPVYSLFMADFREKTFK